MDYSSLIITCFIGVVIGFFVFLLNYNNFIVEYFNLFHLNWVIRGKEYERWLKENNLNYGYPIFIRETYTGFFSKLIGCPICLSTFLSIFFYISLYIYDFFSNFKQIIFIYNLTDLKTILFNFGLIYLTNLIMTVFQGFVAAAAANFTYFKLVDMYKKINN